MPFSQHLSSQQKKRGLCLKSVSARKWRMVIHWPHEQEKRPNCWSVKVWKFSFPLPLGEKESIQGPEIVKCYFSTSFFKAQGSLKSHGYSSLVTILFQNWGLFRCCVPFRPPGILCSLLYDSYHVYGLDEIVKSFFFFTAPLHIFPFFTNHSLAWNHAEWLSKRCLMSWSVFMWISPPSHHSFFFFLPRFLISSYF